MTEESPVEVQPHNEGIVRQRQLGDFLYAELLHTIGSYRLARSKFSKLEHEVVGGRCESTPPPSDVFLADACRQAIRCNEGLQQHLHKPGTPRHPSPGETEFDLDVPLLEAIVAFYDVVTAALEFESEPDDEDDGVERSEEKQKPPGERLQELLSVVHDPQRRGGSSGERDVPLRKGRIARMQERRQVAEELHPNLRERDEVGEGDFQALLEDHIQQEGSLHVSILRALTEAHKWMHVAEHLRRQSFGEMFSELPATHALIQRMLRYALVLNTFVFVAAQIVPWAYAEDEEERDLLSKDAATLRENCDRLTPTYCLWIATQFSLLALHRRAFTSWTMGKPDRAYRDFHKLTRLVKFLRRPAAKRAVRVPGTKTFIEGVLAMSELHIGRIYRGQHAHRMALKYFKRSSRHLEGWEDHGEIGEIITNSHWRISGLMNQAKAHYELGETKHCLLGYARAWRAFLCLADSESHATANIEIVNDFIGWVEPIVEEPTMSRVELRERIKPLVVQFETLRSPKHLERLAADIIGRIGHILYVLKLHDLAYECDVKAAQLDPTSTLIAADRLKVEGAARIEGKAEPPRPIPLAEQWPSGGGRFDEAARIIEYTLHRWLAGADEETDTQLAEKQVARKLLNSYLAHTDSSNMKLAQVYRYLMQGKRARKRRTDPRQRTLDLICLRRYSSFFPFLPRPSAFRAPGGGYFVHLREPGKNEKPFGIAIDPGPDFIENLYRCGYGLADLQMIVVTHDHADHIASLDALLALLGIRRGLGDKTFAPEKRRLVIVGNESVVARYRFYDPPRGKSPRERDAVTPLGFREIAEITELRPAERRKHKKGGRLLRLPPALRIEPVKSWGHEDAAGTTSQAFLLSFGDGETASTILFTGDTGTPDPEDEEFKKRFARGEKTVLEAAREADVVVAHLSAVPLKELRELAGLKRGEDEPEAIGEFTELWEKASRQAERKDAGQDEDLREGIEQIGFLLRRLQFGFRSRPEKGFGLEVSPFSYLHEIKKQPEQHLYLNGVLEVAQEMRKSRRWQTGKAPPPLLLIGELREELGTFRTRIAARISKAIFRRETGQAAPSALTADIGLRVRLARPAGGSSAREGRREIKVLCTTCDLDNDLVPEERFHPPQEISEVCVKGEDEGVFYNCLLHDPDRQPDNIWLETVERYDPFGD
jgi:tetratricopeptide (TPR) repeat protein